MVNLISLNVRGLANEKKRRTIFKMCRDRAQIALLQETHSVINNEVIWKSEWGGEIIFAHGESNSKGVCILLQKSLDYRIISKIIDVSGRFLILEIKIEDKVLVICNIYAPNQDCPNFFVKLVERLTPFGENKLLIGDFNLTLDVNLDRCNTYNNNNNSRNIVDDIMDRFSLQDIWRVRNENVQQYSWFKMSQNVQKASRIDMALTDKGLDIENATYFPASFTDHRAIFLSIKTSAGQKRGNGYWKFNNILLQNGEFLNFMNTKLEEILRSTSNEDPIDRWLKIKVKIKNACQQYSRTKKAMDALAISQLLEKIDEYQSNFPLNIVDYEMYEKSRIDLEELQLQHIQGIGFGTR